MNNLNNQPTVSFLDSIGYFGGDFAQRIAAAEGNNNADDYQQVVYGLVALNVAGYLPYAGRVAGLLRTLAAVSLLKANQEPQQGRDNEALQSFASGMLARGLVELSGIGKYLVVADIGKVAIETLLANPAPQPDNGQPADNE